MLPVPNPTSSPFICGSMSESWAVRQSEGLLFDEDEAWVQFLHVHFRIGACEDARFVVGERDLCEVVGVGE